MDPEVFCVDCQVFVELSLSTKNHKRHEIKLKTDILEERKYEFLEKKKKESKMELICLEMIDQKWLDKQLQAASFKQDLDDHSSKINAQIEQNILDGCVIIDTELSEMAKNYKKFKNNFFDLENDKLLKLKKIIENLNESTLREFSLVLPELPKTTPSYNAELKLVFNPASERIIDSKHFPKIIQNVSKTCKKLINSTSQDTNEQDDSLWSTVLKKTAPELLVTPTTSSAIDINNDLPKSETVEVSESSFNLCKDKCPYLVTQDRQNVYALFSRSKKIKIFGKKTQKIRKLIHFSFEPCRMLAIDSKLYLMDLKKKTLFISFEEQVEEISLNAFPLFLSVGANKKVTITSYKNVQSYNPSNASLKTVPGTSNIGGTLRCFDLGSMIIIVSHNKGNNILMCMVDERIVRKYHLKLNIFKKEYFIDVNQNGNVCIFYTKENNITVLDSNFHLLGSVRVQQFDNGQMKDISMDNKNVIFITYVQKENTCKVLQISFLN